VHTLSGGRLNIGPEGTVEVSAEDAECLLRAGWEQNRRTELRGRSVTLTTSFCALFHLADLQQTAPSYAGPTVRIRLPPTASRVPTNAM
jgi:hypothetical protein